ncbi:MAG: CBS domain-containing protein, partial [Ghiorsea sp.]|nr:CBS domain-containing protein [Ghiorsea sp.]
MFAENFMITDIITAQEDELVGDVHNRMRAEKLRMLPVLNKENKVVGLLSTFSIMQSIIPEYLVSGDLNHISFAPDLGILSSKYKAIITRPIHEMLDTSPLFVHKEDSLISVAASISAHGKHEYALVVD